MEDKDAKNSLDFPLQIHLISSYRIRPSFQVKPDKSWRYVTSERFGCMMTRVKRETSLARNHVTQSMARNRFTLRVLPFLLIPLS